MATNSLPSSSREFLQLVSRASYINPFSDEYEAQQRKIAGSDASVPYPEQIKLTIERWNDQLHKLHVAGVTTLKQIAGEDRELLQYAFLYEIYHRFLSAFDELIVNQIAAGERSAPVSFAGKVLALFARRGFDSAEARRYFAIFY